MNGQADRPRLEGLERPVTRLAEVELLSDDELEVELTIAAYAPGRLRWERYQRLLLERVRRRRPIAV